jgi:pimeloyl-ACP methyl ester carboxylesterase
LARNGRSNALAMALARTGTAAQPKHGPEGSLDRDADGCLTRSDKARRTLVAMLDASEERRVPVAPDVELHALLRRGGAGLPYVFVHGLASNARLWDEVADAVAEAGHDSIAVDQRGHGRSSQTDDGYTFATLADDLAAVIDATVDRPVIAVGQSWGANVVLELAARHPDQVLGLGLVDGGFIRLAEAFTSWDEAQAMLAPPSFDHLTKAQLEAMMRQHLAGFSDSAVAAQLANFEELPDGTVRSRLRRSNHMTILRHLWEHDPDAVVTGLNIPMRLLAVNGGGPSQPDRVEAFSAAADSMTVHWVDGHHDVHAEQPRFVADILLDLAREVRS